MLMEIVLPVSRDLRAGLMLVWYAWAISGLIKSVTIAARFRKFT
jgi:hypothetical protein